MIKHRIYQYRNMILMWMAGAAAVLTSLLITIDFRIIIIEILFILISFCLFLMERRGYENELSKAADAIQSMIDGTKGAVMPETLDGVSSKIQHQLSRLKLKIDGYHKMLEKDRDEIRELITEIAHQLRTPLVNVETYLDLLKESCEEDTQQWKYLDAVMLSEQKLSFLIQSFIKMSRFENHLIQIKNTSKNLKETVLRSIFSLHKKAEKKGIHISLNDSQTNEILHDQNWLGEAVYNVLENSVKYSPEKSEIEVELTQNEMFVRINIRDYGIGIQKGEENKIFQRFYRGKKVTTEEGFGIGLYLSREIVTRHSGFIKVKREDPGLSMDIYLPQ